MNDRIDLAPRRISPEDPPDPRRTLDTLATLLIVILVLGLLYLAREILVPIAIAVLLSFVLSPLVKVLRKLGLGKRLSVGIVVLATFLIAVGLGAILARQVSDLAAEGPKLQVIMMQKVNAVRTFTASNAVLSKLNTVLADLQPSSPVKTEKPRAEESPDAAGAPAPAGPLQVQVVSPPPGVLTILQAAIGVAASPLATAAFVAIFIVFILMQREDLRNRFIRLAGTGDLQRTTLAMNDAARRLSRYFLVQVLLNTGFGAAVAGTLTMLGVPSALLWGIVAAFMRFIPYIGALGAAFFPILLAAAVGPGWGLVVETALFFIGLEFVVGQVVEPLVYGHHTGISPIAVVASATFWTWLWGPVGLVLSTPMTVCLVVVGRHVDRLAFLDVLLGDAPPLSRVETFYQRMLSGDPSEMLDHAEEFMAEHSLLDYSDQIAMRALLMAQRDVRRGALEEKRQTRIRDTMRALAGLLAERDDDGAPVRAGKVVASDEPAEGGIDGGHAEPPDAIDPAWTRPAAVRCFAARTPLDEAAAYLLADLLQEKGIGALVEPADSLLGFESADLDTRDTRLAVLSFLDADLSVGQARFAVRRLRRRLPDVPILAAFWMVEEDRARLVSLCNTVRCSDGVSSLPQAVGFCVRRARAAPLQIAPEKDVA